MSDWTQSAPIYDLLVRRISKGRPVELTLVRLQGPAHDVNRENERLRDGFDLIRMGKN